MNFGAMKIDAQTGILDISSALKFTSELDMTNEDVEDLKKQIQSNFRLEVIKQK